jgi:hypothetical protein
MLREDHGLGVFGSGVLRRIFGPKREEVAGDWRRLHNEELCNLYASSDIIRAVKSDRKRPLGRSRSRWEDNLAQDKDQWQAVLSMVMKVKVP